MTKMRPRDPREGFFSAWVIRPVVWLTFQFSREARIIRRVKKSGRIR